MRIWTTRMTCWLTWRAASRLTWPKSHNSRGNANSASLRLTTRRLRSCVWRNSRRRVAGVRLVGSTTGTSRASSGPSGSRAMVTNSLRSRSTSTAKSASPRSSAGGPKGTHASKPSSVCWPVSGSRPWVWIWSSRPSPSNPTAPSCRPQPTAPPCKRRSSAPPTLARSKISSRRPTASRTNRPCRCYSYARGSSTHLARRPTRSIYIAATCRASTTSCLCITSTCVSRV
mmetsp:Transcript_1562/g.4274  ORF Transcript_1562/g.4274 Transcript_1562/m.4274 type:complete len:229 (+) Transcript_1562:1359-2045(+)